MSSAAAVSATSSVCAGEASAAGCVGAAGASTVGPGAAAGGARWPETHHRPPRTPRPAPAPAPSVSPPAQPAVAARMRDPAPPSAARRSQATPLVGCGESGGLSCPAFPSLCVGPRRHAVPPTSTPLYRNGRAPCRIALPAPFPPCDSRDTIRRVSRLRGLWPCYAAKEKP